MQLAVQHPRRHGVTDRRNTNLFLAFLFWAFTYALFAYRAYLRYGDAYEAASTIRLISTFIGAGLYWLVLTKLIDGTRNRPGKPLAVVATILPASIIVLLARVMLDQLGAVNPNGFAGDLRFVMVWGGYFGLWVSASIALRAMPQAKKVEAARRRTNATARAKMLERLASEIASLPTAERKALMESLVVPGTYETADEMELERSMRN